MRKYQRGPFARCVLALYQGTTLVGPLSPTKIWALAPALLLLLRIVFAQALRAGCAIPGAEERV
jgi:hypothetical protein